MNQEKISETETKSIMTECPLCIENFDETKIFKCSQCSQINCTECHKKWLLQSTLEPHCIHCKAMISFDDIIKYFGNKWMFDKYKEHKKDLLFNSEISKISITLNEIAHEKNIKELENVINEKNEKFRDDLKPLYDELSKIQKEINDKLKIQRDEIKPIRDELEQYVNKKIYPKFTYTYKCPNGNGCKGFLNSKFKCELCETNVCKHCYVIIPINETHECKTDDVESFKQIKKEAKPCPNCGEFISKIGGCDQMFCIKPDCGTAFSWKTGQIENGLIHNPHAHAFFEQNTHAREIYQNNINNNNGNNCRAFIPPRILIENKFLLKYNQNKLNTFWRTISEFRHYDRNKHTEIVERNNEDESKDIRRKYVDGFYNDPNNDKIADKKFKTELHKRNKLKSWEKHNSNLVLSTYSIAELFLWEMANLGNIKTKFDINDKKINQEEILKNNSLINEKACAILVSLNELIDITNKNFESISKKFEYTKKKTINDNFFLI